jgi:hypothetical protein
VFTPDIHDIDLVCTGERHELVEHTANFNMLYHARNCRRSKTFWKNQFGARLISIDPSTNFDRISFDLSDSCGHG